MKLQVKAGREYVLGGKVYNEGQSVDVGEKYVKILTLPKGPLEVPTGPEPKKFVDLPDEVMTRQYRASTAHEPEARAAKSEPLTEVEEDADPKSKQQNSVAPRAPVGRYRRRDLKADDDE